MNTSAPSSQLAAFVHDCRWDDVPAAIRHEACRSLVNYFAVALAGWDDPAVSIAHRVSAVHAAAGTATVIGRPGHDTGLLRAASLNAMAANVFDYDDTHLPTIIHPTAPVAPAAFAWAEHHAASGRDLLLAFVLGVEVECRIGDAVSPFHYQRGWHITSTCGVFGAAMATAKLMGLDARAVRWALAAASAQAGGLVETLGTMAKSLSVGHAAANGLLAAQLAAAGFEGPQQPLEGPRGFVRVTGGNDPDIDALTRGLGHEWALSRNTYKPYPCGVVLNPVIEAALQLHRSGQAGPPDSIDRVELRGHPLLRERTDRPRPASGRESQVSAQHAVAAALATGRAGLDEFSDDAVRRAEHAWLADRLSFVDDASLGVETATLTVIARDGSRHTAHIEAAAGSLQAPLADRVVTDKLATLATWGGSGVAAQPLGDAVWQLEDSPNAGALMRLASPRFPSHTGDPS